jgi:hypothetical protein
MTPEQKANLSPTASFTITLSSGIVAGFAAAVLSHVSGDPSLYATNACAPQYGTAAHEQSIQLGRKPR